MTTNQQPKSQMKTAILIPVFNEGPVIVDTINSVIRAGFAKSDIYLVDDCSTDETVDRASLFGISVLALSKNQGKAGAQRTALAYFQLTSRYDLVTFMDGDTELDPGFLKAVQVQAEKHPKVQLFVGQVCSDPKPNIWSASRAFDYTYGQEVAKHGQSNFGLIFVAPGCASVYRSGLLRRLDLDSSTLAEDMDLTFQAHKLGAPVLYVPEARVYTQDPGNARDYWKQTNRWFTGFWQVCNKHQVWSRFPRTKLDAYLWFITIDSLFFNRAVVMLVLLALGKTETLGLAIGLDFMVSLVIAVWAGWRTHRSDVIVKFPAYYPLAFVNLFSFLRSCWIVNVNKNPVLAWNKVQRY